MFGEIGKLLVQSSEDGSYLEQKLSLYAKEQCTIVPLKYAMAGVYWLYPPFLMLNSIEHLPNGEKTSERTDVPPPPAMKMAKKENTQIITRSMLKVNIT